MIMQNTVVKIYETLCPTAKVGLTQLGLLRQSLYGHRGYNNLKDLGIEKVRRMGYTLSEISRVVELLNEGKFRENLLDGNNGTELETAIMHGCKTRDDIRASNKTASDYDITNDEFSLFIDVIDSHVLEDLREAFIKAIKEDKASMILDPISVDATVTDNDEVNIVVTVPKGRVCKGIHIETMEVR